MIEAGKQLENLPIAEYLRTQLHGSMWHYKRYDLFGQFLNEMEAHATGPWYKWEGLFLASK